MILPCDNLTLRSVASQRPAGSNIAAVQDGPGHVPVERVFMSYTVERQLTDFFAAEIDLHLRLDAMKRQLHSKHDWNLHTAFATVDTTRDGHLNYRNIQSFIKLNG